ncbi:MAG TPA: glycosyltransferase [Thermomicrobiales bacterium]|jgi:GT2 family glycosyltransferase
MPVEPTRSTGNAQSPLPLAVIVLTKDEERDLPACLSSVAELGVPVLVLDSGSRDRTVAIARASGAQVHVRPFTGYATQRNAALQLISSRWVLFLDADERLTPAGCAEIRALLRQPERDTAPVGYWVPRQNEFFGQRLSGGGWWPDYQLRLFRADRARYDESREVHEIVILDGPDARLTEPLIHRNYDSWGEFHAKQRAYAARHARDLAGRGLRPKPWTYATMPLREFRRRYIALDARRDGRLGLALSLAMAWYEGRAYWQLGRIIRQGREAGAPLTVVAHTPLLPTPLFRRSPVLDLSIVIVSRDTRDLTLGCLVAVTRSLARAGVTWELILVDNGSSDGTAAAVRAAYPAAHVIEAGGNRGFAVGNNLGLREAAGRAILLLNPDTEPIGDAIPHLLDALHADPALGVVGPMLRYPDGSPQEARRRFPTRLTPFVESTIVQSYWRRNQILDRYYLADRPADRAQDVDWLYGACLLVRRQALAGSGGFDAGFFMYSEELDLCARIRAAGWRIGYLPTATVIHHEGASSAQAVPRRQINFNTSKVRFYRRRFGILFSEALRAFLLLTFAIQLLQEAVKWLLGHKRPLRRQRVAAHLLVLRSRLRPTGEHLCAEAAS